MEIPSGVIHAGTLVLGGAIGWIGFWIKSRLAEKSASKNRRRALARDLKKSATQLTDFMSLEAKVASTIKAKGNLNLKDIRRLRPDSLPDPRSTIEFASEFEESVQTAAQALYACFNEIQKFYAFMDNYWQTGHSDVIELKIREAEESLGFRIMGQEIDRPARAIASAVEVIARHGEERYMLLLASVK